MVEFFQQELELPAFNRGYHIITRHIVENCSFLPQLETGILHIFIQHTSASLTINENADPSVREDFKSYFDRIAPENASYYTHTQEGSDDMPAHLKNALLGSSLSIPVSQGRLNLGIWQGIYLCEHRNRGGRRRLVLSAWGNSRNKLS
ncbi:secondary thiamine-phosphate synthase enzyme YjbQ [Cesiribacter sp. SM1]|uniref:secondary thiamine-phosphate synthase enzyme YjbQ n=1 Tax=Cesiribacter sp. SM1 TaxID=2861196 RepID=UPI001CD7F9C4